MVSLMVDNIGKQVNKLINPKQLINRRYLWKRAYIVGKRLRNIFSQYTKGLRRRELEVITNLDIDLYEGEILAVVGSSGSGKSLLAHAILGILPDNATTEGNIIYKGKSLSLKDKEKLRGREIVFIPQSVNF